MVCREALTNKIWEHGRVCEAKGEKMSEPVQKRLDVGFPSQVTTHIFAAFISVFQLI